MNIDGILEQLRELWAERRRVVWVALGVAWGTLSLSLLVAFGNSFVKATHGTMDHFGRNLLRISGGSTTVAHRGVPAGRPIPLRAEDAELLRALPGVAEVEVECSSGGGNPTRYQDIQANVPLSGAGHRFQDLRGMVPQPGGRFLNSVDVDQRRRVCFLGHRTKERLFGDANAIGEVIEIHGTPFTVVGVRKENVTISNYNGDDREKVTIPYTTFIDLRGWTGPSHLFVKVEQRDHRAQVLDSIYALLGARAGFAATDHEALYVQDYMDITDMINGMLDGNRVFNGIVGLFGLLVAILGVMNVMYVMVEERRREIGVRIAIGARTRDILSSGLTEAMVVTLVGGLFGMLLCVGLFLGIDAIPLEADVRAFIGYPQMSYGLASLVILILVAAGCLAGWFPAKRAASLDPVEVLREE